MATGSVSLLTTSACRTHSIESGLSDRLASCDLGMPAAGLDATYANANSWRTSLGNVVPACVVLKVTQTRSFDTEVASSSYATGFIVDKARGIILTNRHVVTPGPVTAEAIFLNREEVPVLPVYYDPVHDYGFMRFDPAKVQFLDLHEIPLIPQAAVVGLEVRVVGNDAGEKISILAGTLARLDRDAPIYGKKNYNDFNTFYIGASSGSKGGSSGSPVVDCHGQAVALNAGGKDKASSAFYLPLDRVVRSLRLIQEGAGPGPDLQWGSCHIPRGDLQTTFLFKGFDEARRLGLRHNTEADVRAAVAAESASAKFPGVSLQSASTGMLVVDNIVPGSSAEGQLEPGDVVIQVEGQVVTHFLTLEGILDEAVGGDVTLSIERGGRPMQVTLQVQDLHAVTPSTFLEVSGSILHSLSYQQARNSRLATGLVYVAEAGFLMGQAGIPKHSIIISLNGIQTPDLVSFVQALCSLEAGSRPAVRYFTMLERHRKKRAVLHIDHTWYGQPQLWTRDDATGSWTIQPPAALHDSPLQTQSASAQRCSATSPQIDSADGDGDKSSATALHEIAADCEAGLDRLLQQSLVLVTVEIPHVGLLDGTHAKSFTGNGVIVHASEHVGLVVVDRSTVTVTAGSITLSFGGYPVELTACVRFLHPLHNFAILSYDSTHLSVETIQVMNSHIHHPVTCPRAKASKDQSSAHTCKWCMQAQQQVKAVAQCLTEVKRGEEVQLAGLSSELRFMRRSSRVTSASHALKMAIPTVPRFRPVHEEVIELDHDFGDTFCGVLSNSAGEILALWANYNEQHGSDDIREYCRGLPLSIIKPWVDQVLALLQSDQHKEMASNSQILVGTLEAELEPLVLSKAAQYGLPAVWINRLAKLDPERRQVLRVHSCAHGSHAAEVLKDGDLVLAVNEQPVTSYTHVENIIAAQHLAHSSQGHVGCRTSELHSKLSAGCSHETKENSTVGLVAKVNSSASVATTSSPQSMHAAMQDKTRAAAINSSTDTLTAPIAGSKCQANDTNEGFSRSVSGNSARAAISLTIYRDAAVKSVRVQLGLEDGLGTRRLVHWCGALLQAPHRPVRALGFAPPQAGVYISRWHHGSPAHRYGLYALNWVTELNGVPVPDLNTFVQIAQSLPDKSFACLKLCQLETTKTKVLSIKLDNRYWPMWELVLDPRTSKWSRHVLSSSHTQSCL